MEANTVDGTKGRVITFFEMLTINIILAPAIVSPSLTMRSYNAYDAGLAPTQVIGLSIPIGLMTGIILGALLSEIHKCYITAKQIAQSAVWKGGLSGLLLGLFLYSTFARFDVVCLQQQSCYVYPSGVAGWFVWIGPLVGFGVALLAGFVKSALIKSCRHCKVTITCCPLDEA